MIADPHRNQAVLRFGLQLDEAENAIILLHGRGGSPRDMLSLGEALGGSDFAFLAPKAADGTWYPRSFLSPLEQNEPSLTSALDKVEALVQLVAAAGISAENLVIAGFSQGACLATEFVARHPRKYAGLVAFTGGLIGSTDSELAHSGDLAGTPSFLGSGDPDPHVPWSRVNQSAEIIRTMGAYVGLHRYPGMPHTVTSEEIAAAREHIPNLSISSRR